MKLESLKYDEFRAKPNTLLIETMLGLHSVITITDKCKNILVYTGKIMSRILNDDLDERINIEESLKDIDFKILSYPLTNKVIDDENVIIDLSNLSFAPEQQHRKDITISDIQRLYNKNLDIRLNICDISYGAIPMSVYRGSLKECKYSIFDKSIKELYVQKYDDGDVELCVTICRSDKND